MTNQITIIGVGLIGGSFALALKDAGVDVTIVGYGRNEDHLKRAVSLGIVDQYYLSLSEAVTGSDMVLLAAPVGANVHLLPALADVTDNHCIITDAGSVKQSVVNLARASFSTMENFVPAHPIAGTEHSGVESGFASLYRDKRLIITPVAETAASAIAEVQRLWELTGAIVETMTPSRHDEVFAATSHLPHLLAFTLVETLFKMDQKEEVLKFASGGFSDFTRIASSDPVMWRDICLHNPDSILTAMGALQDGLTNLRDAIQRGDGSAVEDVFRLAKETRDERILDKVKNK